MSITRFVFWLLAHTFTLATVVLLFVNIWVTDDPRIGQTALLSLVLGAIIYIGLGLTYTEEDDGV